MSDHRARTLMVVGTSSSAGKSLIVTALCRVFARMGVRVAPFKGQNLSNNAAVCSDGSEIGRAQAVQALAAGIAPSVDMNPLLLKPGGGGTSQVILSGRPAGRGTEQFYRDNWSNLWDSITGALDRLRAAYDLVIIEGAGAAAELNNGGRDLANLSIARYAGSPALLVGDIERGGVFAQLLGTLWLLPPGERELIKGFIVNKFHGDVALFDGGVSILQERSGVPVLGIVPFLEDLALPEEDAASLDGPVHERRQEGATDIAVIHFPHIANFDDFDPLSREPGVYLHYVASLQDWGNPAAVILPGTRATMADLAWLRSEGLADAICRAATGGLPVVGICGGYQMLGRSIRDPGHTESDLDSADGLGLLNHTTAFDATKTTHQVRARLGTAPGWMAPLAGQTIDGYEIHMGRSLGGTPWLLVPHGGQDEAVTPQGNATPDGRCWGCYLHGIFSNETFRRTWLASLGWRQLPTDSTTSAVEESLDRLADAVLCALDMDVLQAIIEGRDTGFGTARGERHAT